MICYLIGRILLVEAALMLLPLVTALLYGEAAMPFLAAMAGLTVVGLALSRKKPDRATLYARDGFAVVALVWLLMSAFGALPLVLSGDIPNFVNAFFETVSGFTTTGATILTEVETLSRSGLLWRSFTLLPAAVPCICCGQRHPAPLWANWSAGCATPPAFCTVSIW